MEAAWYAGQGETGCFFTLARRGGVDRLADAPFTILNSIVQSDELEIIRLKF